MLRAQPNPELDELVTGLPEDKVQVARLDCTQGRLRRQRYPYTRVRSKWPGCELDAVFRELCCRSCRIRRSDHRHLMPAPHKLASQKLRRKRAPVGERNSNVIV